ncbi:MAG: HPP family protein, partial [Candidatus Microthrix parvicella]
ALATEVTWPRVGAAAVSLGLTSGFMVWLKVPHPPAGATTLIVSLGILKTPAQLTVLMIAVVLMVVQGMVINRLAGIDYPTWAPKLS